MRKALSVHLQKTGIVATSMARNDGANEQREPRQGFGRNGSGGHRALGTEYTASRGHSTVCTKHREMARGGDLRNY